MNIEYDKFSFKYEYRGISFYFDQPELPNISDLKITVLAKCSKCGKEQIITLKNFKYTVNTKGNYYCRSCKLKDRNKFYIDSFPRELNIKILEGAYKNEPIRIGYSTKLEIECQECHKTKIIRGSYLFDTFFKLDTYICNVCKRKHTNLRIYGSTAPAGNAEIQRKIQITSMEKYRVSHWSKTEEFKEKVKQTSLERYGVENPMQNEEVKKRLESNNFEKYGVKYVTQLDSMKEKSKKTCIEKYGKDSYTQTEEFKEKFEQTSLERYGTKNPMQNEEVRGKFEKTCKERYGENNVMKVEEFKLKNQQTCIDHYGKPFYFQTKEAQATSYKFYKYKGMNFDSSWELAFYIYHEDYGIPITRLPLQIEYFLEEESHIYNPNFEVNGQLIEIKSSVLLNEDYSLKPHIKNLNRCKTEEEKQRLYDICAVKTQCMKDNNVQIISNNEIKPYFKYIRDVYGKDYLKQFKNK